ncbi:MAG: helix-turn-helix transcriptional regulator [Phaeodactylibacter sp.]|nr:helix-turn-helix transcriptional regulator [Phaeodactylibacter sp.]
MNQPVVAEIGKKIRKVRQDRSLTVQQLADRAGVSKGLISRIENNRTVPSLPVLINIIKGLEVEISLFFEDIDQKGEADQILVFRKGEQAARSIAALPGLRYLPILSKSFSDFILQTRVLELAPNTAAQKDMTDAFEYKYVLDGALEFEVGSQSIALDTGDSLLFDGRLPHCPVNSLEEKARVLEVSMLLPSGTLTRQ